MIDNALPPQQHRHFIIALLLGTSCFLAALESTARTAGPVGAGFPSQADKQLAKRIGIRLAKPYSATRLQLTRLSWQPATDWGVSGAHASPIYPAYPEIQCGEGMDAICTARFGNHGKALLLTIDQHKAGLPVVHLELE